MDFIAHKREKSSEVQALDAHLSEVGALASSFAQKIGISDAGLVLGLLHDFGKYSKAFQDYLNSAVGRIKPDEDEFVDAKALKGKIDHSTAGAQYIWNQLQTIGAAGQGELVAQILSLCIASHHSGLINCIAEDGSQTFLRRIEKDDDQTHLQECLQNVDTQFMAKIEALVDGSLVRQVFEKVRATVNLPKNANETLSKTDAFSLGVFTRFLFSCLIDADRLNSAEFENPLRKQQRLGQQAWQDWTVAIDRFESFINQFKQKRPIDGIRKGISETCKARANDPQGIYSLTVPTGGGKTLASLRYALHHAHKHRLDRIIYIIPYTSIIEQNASEVRKILERESDPYPWVLEHHSNIEPEQQTWHSKLVSENWDSPIVFTTTVQFLEALFSGGTRGVRRMHQLANSVLIFDEIQTLPINCIHLFCNALNFLSKHAKSTAILCTATQPVLDKLRFSDKGQLAMSECSELINDTNTLFDQLSRVVVNNRIKIGGWSEQEVTLHALSRYRESGSCLIIVNTKAWAQKLYVACCAAEGSDSVFHLSTSLYPAHRKAQLDLIRERLEQGLPVLCISTQLIEAGVDVSFASVIRFLAGLDSIAQAAGRCNRHGELCDANGNYIKGQVDIINPDTENLGMLKDIAIGQEQTLRVLSEFAGSDLLTPEVIQRYFQYYFYARSDDMEYTIKSNQAMRDDTLLEILGRNSNNVGNKNEARRTSGKLPMLAQSFMDAGRAFQAIDAPTKAVVVRHGKGVALVNELCRLAKEFEPQEYYRALKEAQQYSVNVFPNVWAKLLERDAVHETQEGEGIYYLDAEYYSEEFGLATEPVRSMDALLC
tara:strand:- start:34373 stop:36856 length:2484 start_codon:yes stop_codon:yes gene_type:complete